MKKVIYPRLDKTSGPEKANYSAYCWQSLGYIDHICWIIEMDSSGNLPAVISVNNSWSESKKKNMISKLIEAPKGRSNAWTDSIVWPEIKQEQIINDNIKHGHWIFLKPNHTVLHTSTWFSCLRILMFRKICSLSYGS